MNASPLSVRYCIRCTDCLAVAFVEVPVLIRPPGDAAAIYRAAVHAATPPPRADCAACDGMRTVETMGEVRGVHVGHNETRCACDGRCTHAKGPDCECSCGGANHGTGATVTLFVVDGKAPRAMMPSTAAATATAVEWRAIVRAAEDALTTVPQWASGIRYRLKGQLREAAAMRQHKARVKRVAKAIADCAASVAKCYKPAGGAP